MPRKTAIQPVTPSKKLSKKQLADLASFTDPGSILSILGEEEYTVDTAIRELVRLAKNESGEVKAPTQLAAIRYLNQLIEDTMERSGLMVIATKEYDTKDGGHVRFSGQVVSSVLEDQKEPETTSDELNDNQKQKVKNVKSKTHRNIKRKAKDSDTGHAENLEAEEESGESGADLHTSKAPTGAAIEGGHFDGISGSGQPSSSSADFL